MDLLEFDIAEKIHESERSVIYRAREIPARPRVVLKVLYANHPSPQRLARLRREFDIAGAIRSPQVITVHRVESVQGSLVGVLEDFGEGSLDAWIRQGVLSLREAIEVAIGLCRGLGDIHNQGVIHNNISPSNVLFSRAAGATKLIDFGIASLLERASIEPRAPRILEGTLHYMSPEQTGRMNRVVDYRTDFYSLGATLYELFTGQKPFAGDDPLEIIHGHLARPPLPPEHHQGALPQPISELILKLLEKNAEDRYQSAEGILNDLLEVLRQMEAGEAVRRFPLARRDVSGRFRLPTKLYGRKECVRTLTAAFDRAVAGESVFSMVTGHSGVGVFPGAGALPTAHPRERTLHLGKV